MGREFRRDTWIHVYVWLSPFTVLGKRSVAQITVKEELLKTDEKNIR